MQDSKWTSFDILGVMPGITGDVVTAHNALQSKVNALMTERSKLDADRASLREADLATMAKLGSRAAAIADREVGLLQLELKIRAEYAPWLDSYGGAIRALTEKTYNTLEAMKADVRKRLVSIGFYDTGDSLQRGSILPGFILQHPEVRTATENLAAMQSDASVGVHHQMNDAAAEAVTARLATIRDNMLAV